MKAIDESIFVTYSLGATISNKDGSIDTSAIQSICEQFKRLISESSRRIRIISAVGAGGLGRDYAKFASDHLKLPKSARSIIGIKASHVNASLFAESLRNMGVVTNAVIPTSIEQANSYLKSSDFRVVVLGGLEQSMTCDSTAATIAKLSSNYPNFVIVSTAGGILFESPREGSKKRILPMIDSLYLKSVLKSKPKEHVFDIQTCKILLAKSSRNKALGMMKVAVTGYPNILQVTRDLLRAKKNTTVIKNATRVAL